MGSVTPLTSNPRYFYSYIFGPQEYILHKLNSKNRVGLPLSSSGIDFSEASEAIYIETVMPPGLIQLIQRLISISVEAPSSISTSWINPSLFSSEQRRLVNMGLNLSKEVKYFIQKLQRNIDTKKIIAFDNKGITNIWAIVQAADIDLELKYSRLLMETMEAYPNSDFEFMVFDEEELCNIPVPGHAKTIFCKEGD